MNYGSDKKSADSLISELGSDKAIAIQADAGSLSGVEKMVKETVDKFGGIDVLFLNAGTMPMKTVESTSEVDFDKIFALNVKGPWFLVQKALPHMKQGSKVIFVSTSVVHASHLSAPYSLYATTKGAVESMTHSFAKDLGEKGINVNCIAPGPVGTDLFYHGKTKEMIQFCENFSPYKRLGKPEDIADVFMFLASDASAWVSGQVIMVNGGFAFQS